MRSDPILFTEFSTEIVDNSPSAVLNLHEDRVVDSEVEVEAAESFDMSARVIHPRPRLA